VRDLVDVDSARSDVGRNKHRCRARLEAIQGSRPGALVLVPVDRTSLDAEPSQDPDQFVGAILGARPAWTETGPRRMASANRRIAMGMVAEKSSVWRREGRRSITLRMSRMNPMSSMRSASSSTSTSMACKSTTAWSIRSSRRPGVATSTSTPARSLRIWGPWLTPPKTTACRSARLRPYAPKLSKICVANSRVGQSTKARGVRPFALLRTPRAPWGAGPASRWRIGRAKAPVFPVPVWAQPRTSFPASATGMASLWIGVGVV
jgi:hypothetical protein